jgi:hypothetical protein
MWFKKVDARGYLESRFKVADDAVCAKQNEGMVGLEQATRRL